MSELRQWLKEKRHKTSPWGEKLDSNGYSESLLPSEGCYLCGLEPTVRHEVFFGNPDRQTSKAVGCWVNLCPKCHRSVHKNPYWQAPLKQQMQRRFEQVHSHEEFVKLFSKNYL